MLLGRRRVDQDTAAQALDEHRVVGGLGQRVGIGERLAQRVGAKRLGSLDRPEAGAVQRPLHLTSLARLFDRVCDGRRRDRAGRLVIRGQSLDHCVDQRRGHQGPRRIVDHDDLLAAELQRVGHRLRAVLAARHGDDPALGHRTLLPRRHRHDYLGDARSGAKRVERPVEQWPPGELDEGLRAAGSESLPGAGGRDDGRCGGARRSPWRRRSSPPAARRGSSRRPPHPCRART